MTKIANQVMFIDRSTICFARWLPTDIARAWSAITVESELNQWFMQTQLDLKIGGAYSLKDGWDGHMCIRYDSFLGEYYAA